MALLVSDHDGNSPKVWQPWYVNADSNGVHKELPSRVHREQRIRDRTPLYVHNRNINNMSNLKDVESASKRIYGPPEYIGNFSPTTCYNDELPLDMSMKRKAPFSSLPSSEEISNDRLSHPIPSGTCSPPPHQHAIKPSVSDRSKLVPADSIYPTSYDQSEGLCERPSVITCASTKFSHDYSPSAKEDLSPLVPPPSYNMATAHLREHSHASLPEPPPSLETRKLPSPYSNSFLPKNVSSANTSKSRLVQASPVDPEIDEHFRRSLGTHYQQLFVSPSLEEESDSNDSVDDHFTKALGETWRKLKASKGEQRCERKSPDRFVSEGSNSLKSHTPPNSAFRGTADVSITRVSATNATTGQSS